MYEDDYKGDLQRVLSMLEQEQIHLQEIMKVNTEQELKWHLKNAMDNIDRIREALVRTYERDLEKEIRKRFHLHSSKFGSEKEE